MQMTSGEGVFFPLDLRQSSLVQVFGSPTQDAVDQPRAEGGFGGIFGDNAQFLGMFEIANSSASERVLLSRQEVLGTFPGGFSSFRSREDGTTSDTSTKTRADQCTTQPVVFVDSTTTNSPESGAKRKPTPIGT